MGQSPRVAFITIMLLAGLAPARAAVPATQRADSDGTAVAQRFMQALAAGDTKAASDMVDPRAMAMGIYGQDLELNIPAHLEEAYPRLAWLAVAYYCETPKQRQMVAGYGKHELLPLAPEIVEVDFPLAGEGKARVTLRVILRRTDQWKVIDLGFGQSGMLITSYRVLYEKSKARLAPAAHILHCAEAMTAYVTFEKNRACDPKWRTAPPPRYPTTRFASAIDAAREYVQMSRTHRLAEAIDLFSDNERMLRLAFGQAYDQMSEGDRNELLWRWREMMRPVLANKTIGDLMARATWSGLEQKQLPNGVVGVTVTMTFQTHRNTQTMQFYKSPDGWKIFDTLQNDPGMVEVLRSAYRESSGNLTPLECVIHMKEESDRIAERARRVDQGLPPGR